MARRRRRISGRHRRTRAINGITDHPTVVGIVAVVAISGVLGFVAWKIARP